MIPRLAECRLPVERAAASVEETFLMTGESLGRGLEAFAGINADTLALVSDLQSGDMTDAAEALRALSERLVTVGRSLPRDAASLWALVEGNATISKHLETLLENIRMMTIIARSARIESVVFGEDSGLDAFTAEISRLTAAVCDEIGGCASAHASLTDRICKVAEAQATMDRDFRDRLLALSQELASTFAVIEERQRQGVSFMTGTAIRSARMATDIGTALMSLQSGDCMRQRLEHVATALGVAQEVAMGQSGSDGGGRLDLQPAVAAAICGLQGAQIADGVATFSRDVDGVDTLIGKLLDEASELVGSIQTIYGIADAGADSFLAVFRTRLEAAAGLLALCEGARTTTEAAILDLRRRLAGLSRTISDLSATTLDLIMVGVNAGLKAGRLGAEGRSLMVIADELKRLAGLITRESSCLMGVFSDVRDLSHGLDRTEAACSAGPMDDVLLTIVESLQAVDARVSGAIQSLRARAQQFDGDLSRARARLDVVSRADATLLPVATALQGVAAPWGIPAEALAASVDALLLGSYTMAREREIHVGYFGQSLAVTTEGNDPETMFDDCDVLFAEAS